MSTGSPTRAALLELKDERHAMREGYVFLDEKCLLLAGEMLRQLRQHATLEAEMRDAHERAMHALHAALARHGLQGLQVQPAVDASAASVSRQAGSLMGVRLQQAKWESPHPETPDSVGASPELHECRRAFALLAAASAPLAAVVGNLERLSQEYRRSVRRARALQDVLLPALERDVADIETRLEELEQQEAVTMRHRA
ncbi:MAG: hypothetical protein OEW27_05100 [Aquincola sp.]|nr:hypothetical protein [Aquincola sp.]